MNCEKNSNIFYNWIFIIVFFVWLAVLDSNKDFQNIDDHEKASISRIGELIHESVVDDYMLAYHILDLWIQN